MVKIYLKDGINKENVHCISTRVASNIQVPGNRANAEGVTVKSNISNRTQYRLEILNPAERDDKNM